MSKVIVRKIYVNQELLLELNITLELRDNSIGFLKSTIVRYNIPVKKNTRREKDKDFYQNNYTWTNSNYGLSDYLRDKPIKEIEDDFKEIAIKEFPDIDIDFVQLSLTTDKRDSKIYSDIPGVATIHITNGLSYSRKCKLKELGI